MNDLAVVVDSSLFDFDAVKKLVIDSVSSENSKRVYSGGLEQFFAWWRLQPIQAPISKAMINAFKSSLEARGLAPSSINVVLSAVRKLVQEAADNDLLAPEIAAAVLRIKGVARHGVRTGNWLTKRQAEQILDAPDATTLKGKRNRAVLALLIGCGLRRAELAALTVGHIQQRDGRWVLLDVCGKGKRIRSIPMPAWAYVAVEKWLAAAALHGFTPAAEDKVFCAMARWDKLGCGRLDEESIRALVRGYAQQIGVGDINPHDCRRTYAKLAHRGHAPLEQIQLSLGHASIQTTERYLGVTQDLTDAPCDHLGLRVSA
jgi:site-specific recombinase XerD